MTKLLTENQRENIVNWIQEMQKNPHSSESLSGGSSARQPSSSQHTDYLSNHPQYQLSKFIAETLSDVLSTEQNYGIIETGQPTPPMSQDQRTQMTEKILRNLLSQDQIDEITQNNSIEVSSLSKPQQQMMIELAAGYTSDQILDPRQFQRFKTNEPLAMSLNQASILHPFFKTRNPQSSKFFMEMGKYMDRPATDFVNSTTGRLSGGSRLPVIVQVKNHLNLFSI